MCIGSLDPLGVVLPKISAVNPSVSQRGEVPGAQAGGCWIVAGRDRQGIG